MTDKHIVKVRSLGACVIITVPAAVRDITGIEPGNYVYVETTGKRGFSVAKGAIPAKKSTPKKAVKPAAKKKVAPPKKKVVKPAPAPKKKVAAKPVPKPAPKKLIAPPVKKKIAAPKLKPAQVEQLDLPIQSMPADGAGEE